jgi:hypothetical protein
MPYCVTVLRFEAGHLLCPPSIGFHQQDNIRLLFPDGPPQRLAVAVVHKYIGDQQAQIGFGGRSVSTVYFWGIGVALHLAPTQPRERRDLDQLHAHCTGHQAQQESIALLPVAPLQTCRQHPRPKKRHMHPWIIKNPHPPRFPSETRQQRRHAYERSYSPQRTPSHALLSPTPTPLVYAGVFTHAGKVSVPHPPLCKQ